MSETGLGEFIRERREAITPAEVGLPAGSRRRTPGLRRTELAMLAGISVEYLTRLEQGRDRHPSAQVLSALGEALLLSPAERSHLRLLWKSAGGGDVLCAAAEPPARDVRPTVRAVLHRLDPMPAFAMNRLGDILAATPGFERLVAPLGVLDEDVPNLLRYAFTDERALQAFPQWACVADHLVNRLRTIAPSDVHTDELVEELTVTAGSAFLTRMAAPIVVARVAGVIELHQPDVGPLRLAFESLELPSDDALQLVALLPADEAASAALDRIAERGPRRLRAV
ncbi:helix-turn-helix domain-containing protein [Agromyces albus]|uniref:XRE family transcriptional regulator n=1 Tax=Agromyces albus TaxID=205332 RepID=A0A4Q2KVX5_9MICO|nr:helix-turn-helix transcriptional regulator [Agromyces albus]RXZ69735.1 XRE family transcriptional regulator [Agromyces albus]